MARTWPICRINHRLTVDPAVRKYYNLPTATGTAALLPVNFPVNFPVNSLAPLQTRGACSAAHQ